MRMRVSAGFFFVVAIGMTAMVPLVNAAAQQRSNDRAAAKAPHRAVHYPRIGHRVQSLPRNRVTVRVNRQNYWYHNGSFYHSGRDGVYVVVRAPVGARVRTLPPGYVSFGIGPRHYFYSNITYYLWDAPTREYIVVEEPAGAESVVVAASESVSGEIFVYPNRGQSEEQRDRDRYECYVWAVDQTGFDPGSGEPQVDKAGDYRRAMSACLEGRGYTVK